MRVAVVVTELYERERVGLRRFGGEPDSDPPSSLMVEKPDGAGDAARLAMLTVRSLSEGMAKTYLSCQCSVSAR